MKSQLGCILAVFYGLLASMPVTNALRETMTVSADDIDFKVQRYDDGRDLPYRLKFWSDGERSIYNFYASGAVRLISAGSEAYKVVYRSNGIIKKVKLTSSRRSRALAEEGQVAVEDFDHEASVPQGHRRLYACEDCEEAWDVVCGEGLASVCNLQGYGSPFLSKAEASIDHVCASFTAACASFTSASEACSGQCDDSVVGETPDY